MDLSVFLAQVMAIYYVVTGAALLIRRDRFVVVAKKLLADDGLLLVIELVTLLVGILLIVSHTVWTADWRLVITIISWLIFLKATLYLFLPSRMLAFAKSFLNKMPYVVSGAVTVLLGLFLGYYGFIA